MHYNSTLMSRAKYPHLLQADANLWDRFLARNPRRFEDILYDIRVGEGRDPGDDYNPSIRQMAIDLSQRRIDAIGITPDEMYIIEISCRPGLKAVGQLIAYPILFAEKYPTTKAIRTLLVAETIESDVEPVLKKANIPFELYPA